MAKLTDAQLTTMNRAAQRPDGLLTPTPKTPAHMAHAMAKKLQDAQLVERVEVFADQSWYGQGDGDVFFGYRLTIQGFMALGITSSEWPEYCQPDFAAHDAEEAAALDDGAPYTSPTGNAAIEAFDALAASLDAGVPARGLGETEPQTAVEAQAALEAKLAPLVTPANDKLTVRAAGEAILAAWGLALTLGSEGLVVETLKQPMANLRIALGEPKAAKAPKEPRAPKPAGEPKEPRAGTKQQTVIDMLRAKDGVSNPEIQEATGWAPHTVRGFFAGLKKKGMAVESIKTDAGMVYRIPA